MFQFLGNKLTNIFEKMKSRGVLTEDDINQVMREIRIALLEADVALPVVKSFISEVKESAKGKKVVDSIQPGQMVVKIINDELVKILSSTEEEQGLKLQAKAPVNILIAGLQGSGKTTSTAKLASYIRREYNKKVLLVSLDTYRPAAQQQLEILAKSEKIDSLPIVEKQLPIDIVKRSINEAKIGVFDVVIYDTAGRIHIDEEMMEELTAVKKLIDPQETILVVDSLTGQDAINVASSFDKRVDVTGVILSRIDADARGGAALSLKYITGKPIKFLSTGEKIEDFEKFSSDRVASKILDMGDVVSLVEKAAQLVDEKDAIAAEKKFKKGQFNLNDYLDQMRKIKKLGGISSMLTMIPGANKLMKNINVDGQENVFKRQEAIILSMTKRERSKPLIINGSRRKRVAVGSGVEVQDVNRLLKQFMQLQKFMKKAAGMDKKSLLRSGFKNILG